MTDPFETGLGLTLTDQNGAAAPAAPAAPAAAPAAAPLVTAPAAAPAEPAFFTPNADPADPAATPPVDPGVTPPVATENIYEKIYGGKYNTPDEINSHITELEEKLAEAAKDPFANEYIKGLNKAAGEGIDPDLYSAVATMDIEAMEPKEVLVLQAMWKKGLNQEEAELLVNSKYLLGSDEDADSDAVKLARIDAKGDSLEAKAFLSEYKVDALTPPGEKLLEEQRSAWKSVLPTVSDQFKTLKIAGKTGDYNFQISPESITKANELLGQIVNEGYAEILPDKEGMEFAQGVLYKEILANELPRIIDQIADHYKNAAAAANHNPRLPGGGTPPPAGGPDPQMEIANFLANERGVKLNY